MWVNIIRKLEDLGIHGKAKSGYYEVSGFHAVRLANEWLMNLPSTLIDFYDSLGKHADFSEWGMIKNVAGKR